MSSKPFPATVELLRIIEEIFNVFEAGGVIVAVEIRSSKTAVKSITLFSFTEPSFCRVYSAFDAQRD